MRFESATAHAFGPFAGETLHLAPGLNVVWGPNEAGKSSWHAALYYALCARQRWRGRPSRAEQALIDRHRPWDARRWDIAAVICRANGRRIELRHDLAELVACRAIDLELGRDCSSEILIGNDAPDGAIWLGLDRRSFLAMACVRQADLLAIRDNADQLQDHLQRAAATGGADVTAAAALDRVARFRGMHVGASQVNAVGPLRQATEALTGARQVLMTAQDAHAEYGALAARADALEAQAIVAERVLEEARRRRSDVELSSLVRRLERARTLAARFPEGPPPGVGQDDQLAQDVAAALMAWETLPALPTLDGPDAATLQASLDTLPQIPHGDAEPHTTVVAAREAMGRALAGLDQHERARPADPMFRPAGGLDEHELLGLANDLDVAVEHDDPVAEARVHAAQQRVEAAARRGSSSVPLVVAGAAAIVGTILTGIGLVVASWLVLVGVAVILFGAAFALWTLARRGSGSHARTLEELRRAEADLGAGRFAVEQARRTRDAALGRARERGLPSDPALLRAQAVELRDATAAARDFRRWREQRGPLEAECWRARDRLAAALQARGAAADDDVADVLQTYYEACRRRADEAAAASRRPALVRQIADRRAAERAAQETMLRAREAEAAVREAARRCRIPDAPPAILARRLRAWQSTRMQALGELDEAHRAWAELQSMLGTETLADLDRAVQQRQQSRRRVTASVALAPSEALTAVRNADEPDLDALERAAREALGAATRARGEADRQARSVPSVPEAEEGLAAAQAALQRVEALARTLDLTKQFLSDAEQRVHRDVAPSLSRAVERWLPAVTAGRYTRVLVDPGTLAVQVAGASGVWRDAALLSQGTAEQVYLLLRIALADHLTAPGETCPLILDDATAHFDAERTRAVLATLQALATERQVILFSQEDAVAAWAEQHLRGPDHRLIRLPRPVGAA